MMKDKMKAIPKKIGIILVVYILLMAVFTGAMTRSYSLDDKRIISHVSESAETIEREGMYPKIMISSEKSWLDNFTDSWMLTIAMGVEGNTPLQQAAGCYYINAKTAENRVDNLLKIVKGEKEVEVKEYARYWHGYQVFLRPLLQVFNYEEIRYINMFGIMGLFVMAACLLKEKIGTESAVAFVISMLMSMIIIVPMSMQFSSIYYVTMISIVLLTMFSKKIMKKDLMYAYFFLVGAFTSFFDLLTAPIMTLGFSLVVYTYLELKDNGIGKNTVEIISKSFSWSMGYLMTWSGKWVIAQFITKKEIIKDALAQILSRTSSRINEVEISKVEAITKNLAKYINGVNIKLILALIVITLILFIIMKKKNSINMLPTVLVAFYPIVCYLVMTNHSFLHFWFTYRNLTVSCFAILSFILYTIDFDRYKKRTT